MLFGFQRWKTVLIRRNATAAEYFWHKQLKTTKKILQGWKAYAKKKQNGKELVVSIRQYKQNEIVHKYFNLLKINTNLSRNFAEIVMQNNLRRKIKVIKGLKSYLNSRKFKAQTYIAIKLLYKKRLLKNIWNNWYEGCRRADEEYWEFATKKRSFNAWKQMTYDMNKIQYMKADTLRNIQLFRCYFDALKESVRQSKLTETAQKFRLFNLFHGFFLRIQTKIKSNKNKAKSDYFLKTKYAQRVVKTIFSLFKTAVQESQSERYQNDAVSSYYESKEKERLVLQSFKKLKLNCEINKVRRIRNKMIMIRSMSKWKKYREQQIELKRKIVSKILNKKKKLLQISFFALAKLVSFTKNKESTAIIFYEKKKMRECLYRWMGNIVNDFLLRQADADNYYKFKMKLRCFQGLMSNSEKQIRRRISRQGAEEFKSRKDYILKWKAFTKFKAVIIAELRFKKINYDLVNSIFYNWRLLIKIKQFS